MPLEGHYQRVNTPLRRLRPRERWIMVVALTVTLVAVLALIFVPSSNQHPLVSGRNCIEVGVAGRVGNEPVAGCGQKAVAICRRAAEFSDPRAETIIQACKDQRIDY